MSADVIWALLIGVGIPAIGGLVWMVRQEGRINVLDVRQTGTEKRVDGMEDRIVAQLDRIELKLDTKADKP